MYIEITDTYPRGYKFRLELYCGNREFIGYFTVLKERGNVIVTPESFNWALKGYNYITNSNPSILSSLRLLVITKGRSERVIGILKSSIDTKTGQFYDYHQSY